MWALRVLVAGAVWRSAWSVGVGDLEDSLAHHMLIASDSELKDQFNTLISQIREGDEFGTSVAISPSGEYAIVGAARATAQNNGTLYDRAGAAYIFHKKNDDIWSSGHYMPIHKLELERPMADAQFGYSVAISDSVAVVGAPGSRRYAGSVYIYRRNGDDWDDSPYQLFVTKRWIDFVENLDGNFYGGAVAVTSSPSAGDWVVVGSPGFTKGSPLELRKPESGAAYVYRYHAGRDRWDQMARLVPADTKEKDYFGRSVDISNGRIIVGAWATEMRKPFRTGSHVKWNAYTGRQGAVYIFDTNSSALMPVTRPVAGVNGTLKPPPHNQDLVYEEQGGKGLLQCGRLTYPPRWPWCKLAHSDTQEGDRFGFSVSLHWPYAVVGAPYHHWTGDNKKGSGGAYLYKAVTEPFMKFGVNDSIFTDHIPVWRPVKTLSPKDGHDCQMVDVLGKIDQVEVCDNDYGKVNHGDSFGVAVAVGAKFAVVGADHAEMTRFTPWLTSRPVKWAGKIYVYKTEDPGSCHVEWMHKNQSVNANLFGKVIATSEDGTIIAGVPGFGNSAGAAVVLKEVSRAAPPFSTSWWTAAATASVCTFLLLHRQ